jgi:hypothetical protein
LGVNRTHNRAAEPLWQHGILLPKALLFDSFASADQVRAVRNSVRNSGDGYSFSVVNRLTRVSSLMLSFLDRHLISYPPGAPSALKLLVSSAAVDCWWCDFFEEVWGRLRYLGIN